MSRMLNFKTPIYDDMSIDNYWFSDYGVYIAGTNGITLSVLPSKSVMSTKVVGGIGESFGSSQFEPRTLQLPAYIEDIDNLDSFKKLIMGNELRWFHFKNTNTKIKGIVRNELIVKPYGRNGTFDLEIFCPDPRFYESDPLSRTFSNPVSIQFYNDGNIDSLPIYEVTGKGTINIGVNGNVMTLNLSRVASETLIINTKTKEVRKGQSENRLFSNENLVFPKMRTGENAISVSGTCTSLKITPNSAWL